MARRRGTPVHGWLVLDKPRSITSTHALNKVKRLFDAAKAGHAGTLDPLATGILPIAFGEATKTIQHVVEGTKQYQFLVRWGIETNTDDAEGEPVTQSEDAPDARGDRGGFASLSRPDHAGPAALFGDQDRRRACL